MEDTDVKQRELPFIPDIMYYPEVLPVFLELYWICIIVLLNRNVVPCSLGRRKLMIN